jgi:RpiR family transcriptional regulator, carbohydrate utilization regulator
MSETLDKPRSILARIRWMSPYLNPALRRIADQILKAPELIKSSSINEVARLCQTSESTVTRFVREVEVPSFQQLKILIAEDLSQEAGAGSEPSFPGHVYEDITQRDDANSIIAKINARYVLTAQDTARGLSQEELQRAAKAIEDCSLMAFFAMGSSVICVENALMRFMRIGKPCQFFRDFSVRQISTATLGEKTLAIAISNSGRTITTINSLKEAKARGATTLCITSFPDAPIVKYADIKLFTPTVTAADGSADYQESMVSKVAQLLVIDVLYSLYAVRNFSASIEHLEKTSALTTGTRY